MDLLNLFWIFLVVAALFPLVQRQIIRSARLRLMRALEVKRGSRVIVLIHRQEVMSLLGFPVARYIDIDDSEQLLRAIKLTDPHVPIDLVLHTPGGLVLAAELIANALSKHPSRVTVFVPHYAMSGGTLLALSANEVVMDENAVLGPVDPQIGQYPAASILSVVAQKDVNEVDDQTLILADISRKALQQVQATVQRIACCHYPTETVDRLAQELPGGRWTHDYPITVDEARALGLNVSTEMPTEVYQLMNLYPQSGQRRPSVDFVPMPYPTRPGAAERGEHK